jgi:Protein of unknown function (DUF4242)
MALYLIERNFAEQLNVTPDVAAAAKQVNADCGVQWLYSFLSADKKKTYCLYEATNPDAIREAARRLGLPADVIVELGDRKLDPGAPGLTSPTRPG